MWYPSNYQRLVELASLEWHLWFAEEDGEISLWKPLVLNSTYESVEQLEQQCVK